MSRSQIVNARVQHPRKDVDARLLRPLPCEHRQLRSPTVTSIADHLGNCLHEGMVRRVLAIMGSAVFLVVAPGFVAGLVPWWISHWRLEPPFFGTPISRYAGCILITLGIIGLMDSFVRFAVQGVGTPAPVFPTRHLVLTGPYRYVRNPMYVAVVSTILGQGLIFGNLTFADLFRSELRGCSGDAVWNQVLVRVSS